MLVEILRSDGVAADCCLPREGDISLKNLLRAAANFYAGAAAVKGLIALRYPLLPLEWADAVIAPARILICFGLILPSVIGLTAARSPGRGGAIVGLF